MSIISDSFKYFKRYTPAWISIAILGFITVTCILLTPQVTSLLIDRIIYPALGGEVFIDNNNFFTPILNGINNADYWGLFYKLAIVFFVVFIIKYITHFARWNLGQFFGVKGEGALRDVSLRKLLTQNSTVLSRYTSGELLSIANSDIIVIKDVYSHKIFMFCDALVYWIIGSFFLSKINPLLLIMPIVCGVITVIVTTFFIRAIRLRYNQIRENAAALNTVVQENINGVRIIKSFSSEKIEVEKFNSINQNFYNSFIKQSKTVAKYHVIFTTLSHLMYMGSIALAVFLAVNGKMSIGQFTTFLAYVTLIIEPFRALTTILEQFQNAYIAGTRLFNFLNTSNAIPEPINPVAIDNTSPHITLNNVSVQLDEKMLVNNINLEIPFGMRLGVMGQTGSGKTSFIKTLMRFFETTKGETMINGINIKNIKIDELRNMFSYVMQDVFLFSETVQNNISFFDPKTDIKKIETAAQCAAAHDFILNLSDGYQTVIGEKGIGLSGGQKQRVSIARALVKDAPIFLFDDCLSALDLQTERKILDNLKQTYTKKTIIISSHRASSLADCDKIIFFDNGGIAEQGTHAELLALGGMYAAVYAQQQQSKVQV